MRTRRSVKNFCSAAPWVGRRRRSVRVAGVLQEGLPRSAAASCAWDAAAAALGPRLGANGALAPPDLTECPHLASYLAFSFSYRACGHRTGRECA